MRPSLSRSLVALVSLLLALPPGWCCAALPGEREATAPALHSCCHVNTKTPAGRAPAHLHQRPPAECPGCACPDRDSAAANRPQTGPVQLTLPLNVAPTPAVPVFNESGPTASAGRHVSSPPPQLLHCIWLC